MRGCRSLCHAHETITPRSLAKQQISAVKQLVCANGRALGVETLSINIKPALLQSAPRIAPALEQRVALARDRVDHVLSVERLLAIQVEGRDLSLEKLQRFARQRPRVALAEQQLRNLLGGL